MPNVTYCEYDKDIERHLQLLVPYRPEWERDEKYLLVVFIPGSAWYKQEMYNGIPALSKLAERGIVVAAVQFRESAIARYPAQVEDCQVDVNHSRYLYDLLAGAGKTVDYYEIEGAGHGGAAFWSGNMEHFPMIDLKATGRRIKDLREQRGISVRQLQAFLGFEHPRAIYKWQQGECLPVTTYMQWPVSFM